MMILFSSTRLVILTLTWFTLSIGGFAYWEWHDRTPGLKGEPEPEAFAASRSTHSGLRMTLFLHPHCPCSRATLKQLANCMSDRKTDFELCVYFVRPPEADENWDDSEFRRLAVRIFGDRVKTDVDGKLAHKFGVRTSGQLIIQDPTDSIQFSGGITLGRGIEEDCAGRRAVISLIVGELTAIVSTPVFGCPLFESDSGEAGGD